MSEEQLTDQSVPVETTEEIEVLPVSEETAEEVKERVFTQKELDAIVSKEKARERRKADVPELTVTRLLFLYLSFNFVSNASLTEP